MYAPGVDSSSVCIPPLRKFFEKVGKRQTRKEKYATHVGQRATTYAAMTYTAITYAALTYAATTYAAMTSEGRRTK